jgi:hypothetical protein
MTTKEKLLRTRKRLREDFEFYASHACKIRTKEGTIVPLVLNRVQKRFLKHCLDQLATVGYIRSVDLKGRQQGISTVVSAIGYWWLSQHPAQKGIVIAHKKDSTDTLFTMYKRLHKLMPELLRPSTKYSSKREIVFDTLDTGLVVATAGGEDFGRGETLQFMHLSEVAFWPATYAKENFNGLLKALPNAPGTMCFVESTANGMTGEFHDLWQGAVAGTNGFFPFFSAWFESDEYRATPPVGFTRVPDEEDLALRHDLDDAQLYWRRLEINRAGIELFKQEYPCTADEAFITSGRPVFTQEVLHKLIENAPSPIAQMAVEQVAVANPKTKKTDVIWKLVENPRGELLVYHERDNAQQYYIGADVSVGIRDPDKSDWCVAQVLDGDKRQVAVWRGQVTPDHYARVLNTLGEYYNLAMVAPERNGHGLLVCVRLWKDLNYSNCFTDLKEGEIADRETLNIGFQTNVASKPLIIDKLRGDVRIAAIEINDITTLKEMLSYVVTDNGKMMGDQGHFDDCVMALAIANHIHEGKWTPISVTDDYYSVAI